jgi:cytochrome c oxidase cbb3-type subunit 3
MGLLCSLLKTNLMPKAKLHRILFYGGLAILFVGLGSWWSVVRFSLRAQIVRGDPEQILHNPRLAPMAVSAGRTVYKAQCASCHGSEAQGDNTIGAPNLADHDFLYGSGAVAEIEQIVLYGIRSGDSRGWNLASMPAFGTAIPYSNYKMNSLTPSEIDDAAAYIRHISHQAADPAAVERGRAQFKAAGCWDCHGPDGGGDTSIGAPNLTDKIWLYGDGSIDAIKTTITYGRHGEMPAFTGRITPFQVRSVSLYIASLSQASQLEKNDARRP